MDSRGGGDTEEGVGARAEKAGAVRSSDRVTDASGDGAQLGQMDTEASPDGLSPRSERLRARVRARLFGGDVPEGEGDRYELGDVFASGGMGSIRRAFDRHLGRDVAIKELRGYAPGPDEEARFLREAAVAAQLEHPSIIPIYDVGRWSDGSVYFAMKLVEGESLAALISERETLDDRLKLVPRVLDIAEAMAYAHARGVVHRDLKPANVLVGAFGETVVIDWGLAKLSGDAEERAVHDASGLGAAPVQTQAGALVGTLAFMPPEQAEGRTVDARSDVYSVGAILYTVLAGKHPFVGARSSQELLTRLLAGALPAISSLELGVPADLAGVVGKAMAPKPEDRYPGAQELATDLRSFLEGRLVSAYAYRPVDVVRKWARRRALPLGIAGVATVILAATGVAAAVRVARERDTAEMERDRAEENERLARLRETEARDAANALTFRQAETALSHSATEAVAWLELLPDDANQWSRARPLLIRAAASGVASRVFEPPRAGMKVGDATGDWVVFAGEERVAFSSVGSREQGSLEWPGVTDMAVKVFGDLALVRGKVDGEQIRRGADLRRGQWVDLPDEVRTGLAGGNAVQWHGREGVLIRARGGAAAWLDAETREIGWTLPGRDRGLVVPMGHGNLIAVERDRSSWSFWSVAGPTPVEASVVPKISGWSVPVPGTGALVTCKDQQLHHISAGHAAWTPVDGPPCAFGTRIGLLTGTRTVATQAPGEENTLRVWRWNDGSFAHVGDYGASEHDRVTLAHDASRLALCDGERTLIVETESGRRTRLGEGCAFGSGVQMAPDDSRIVVAAEDRAHAFALPGRAMAHRPLPTPATLSHVDYRSFGAPSGVVVAAEVMGDRVAMARFDLARGRRAPLEDRVGVTRAGVAADGSVVGVRVHGGVAEILVWAPGETSRELRRLENPEHPVAWGGEDVHLDGAVFSPDGRWVALGLRGDGQAAWVQRVDLKSGAVEIGPVLPPRGEPGADAFGRTDALTGRGFRLHAIDPTGAWVAFDRLEGDGVHLWSFTTGEALPVDLSGRETAVLTGSGELAAAGRESAAVLLDTEHWKTRTLAPADLTVWKLLADGRYLVGVDAGAAKVAVWDAGSGELRGVVGPLRYRPIAAWVAPGADEVLVAGYASSFQAAQELLVAPLDGSAPWSLEVPAPVVTAAYVGDGERLAVLTTAGDVVAFDNSVPHDRPGLQEYARGLTDLVVSAGTP